MRYAVDHMAKVYIGSAWKVEWQKSSQGVVLYGRNSTDGRRVPLYVPPALAGDILNHWNDEKFSVLDVKVNTKGIAIGGHRDEGIFFYDGPRALDALEVTSLQSVGSNHQVVVQNIAAIKVGRPWTTIKGSLNGEETEVFMETPTIYLPKSDKARAKLLGCGLSLAGIVKVGLPGNKFMGYGAKFVSAPAARFG